VPEIPTKFENPDRPFYGFDSEDNGYGLPHFYQFAWGKSDNIDAGVAFSHSFRLLYRWASETFKLKKNNHITWCTNLEYDFGNVMKDWDIETAFMDVRWRRGKLGKLVLKYQPDIAEWGPPDAVHSQWDIWDTMNHWPMSVERQGESLSKMMGYDFTKLKKDFYGFKYSAMDAIISRAYASVQRDGYLRRGIPLKLTPGASSFEWYVKGEAEDGTKFCTQRVYETHDDTEMDWLMEGLRGGRTEVFSLKEYEGKVGYFDINSAYPFSMLHDSFPQLSKHEWYVGHDRIAKKIDNGDEGMAECDVDATDVSEFAKYIPYLGILDKETMRLIFPLGRWTGKYTFFEIRQAMKYGYKFRFRKAAIYQASKVQPFKAYVEAAYGLRLEGSRTGDTVLRDIGKSLGNNLYGKFGQRMVFTKMMDPKDYKPEDIAGCARVGEAVIIEENAGFARQTNVIWSAYITSICRDLLYNHMMNAWLKGNEVIYCDTDSIFISGGEWPESDQTKLGALKHEDDLDYFRAFLPKTYMYRKGTKWSYKAKGVPTPQREEFLVMGQVEYRKPLKIRESLRRKKFHKNDEDKGISASVPGVNAWITVHKELSGEYTKRICLPDGDTSPHYINWGEEQILPEKKSRKKYTPKFEPTYADTAEQENAHYDV